MSRFIFVVGALSVSLAACATATSAGSTASQSPPPASAPPATPGCDADAVQGLVGHVASADVVEKARVAAGAQIARTLKPGQMVTMEYHASRLNIDVDANNVITNVRCG
jgi:hypothetical protein